MAAKFRKVDPRFWDDERTRRLTPAGRLLALHLLTGSRVNRCGIVMFSPGLAAEQTGIPYAEVDTVLHTVCDTLNWPRDAASGTVFLRRWWKYNHPDNPKALQGALSDLHDLPRNSLKPCMVKAAEDLDPKLRALYLAALDTVCDTVSDTVSSQEKEKEKEKEPIPAVPAGGSAKAQKRPAKAATTEPAAERTPEPWWPLFEAIIEISAANRKQSGGRVSKLARLMLEAGIHPETLRTELERVRDAYAPFRRTFDLDTITAIWPWILKAPETRGHGGPGRGAHRVDSEANKYPEPAAPHRAGNPGSPSTPAPPA